MLLSRAAKAGADDDQLHLDLDLLDQNSGRANAARAEYMLALNDVVARTKPGGARRKLG